MDLFFDRFGDYLFRLAIFLIILKLYLDREDEFEFTKGSEKVKFQDLVGIDEFKEEIIQIVDFLKNR